MAGATGLTRLTITQAGEALAAGDFSARELAQAHLDAMAAEAELAAAMGSDELKSLKAVLIRIGDTQPSTFQNSAG